MVAERFNLAAERIRQIPEEESVRLPFRAYFQGEAQFLALLLFLLEEIEAGRYEKSTMEELKSWNRKLYEDILPENYETSYGNPAYAVYMFGREAGQLLSFLYSELRGGIPYVFEGKREYLTILMELFIEVYNCFEAHCGEASNAGETDEKEESGFIRELKDIVYWYASDYCDVFAADRVLEQIDPARDFAAKIIETADLSDFRYLYRFGEYVSD